MQPPGKPNVWLPIIGLLLVGAVLAAWLVGSLVGEDVTGLARDLVKNPFRTPRP